MKQSSAMVCGGDDATINWMDIRVGLLYNSDLSRLLASSNKVELK